jgi:hypothetical protein
VEEGFEAIYLDVSLWDSFGGDCTKANIDNGSIRVLLKFVVEIGGGRCKFWA